MKKRLKGLISLWLAVVMMFAMAVPATAISGSAGSYLWVYTSPIVAGTTRARASNGSAWLSSLINLGLSESSDSNKKTLDQIEQIEERLEVYNLPPQNKKLGGWNIWGFSNSGDVATTDILLSVGVDEAVTIEKLYEVFTEGLESLVFEPLWVDIIYYDVTYDLKGGIGAEGVDYTPVEVEEGTTTVAKAAPAREGYTFLGWSDGTNIYLPGAEITVNSDITLTAQWKSDSTVDANLYWYLMMLMNRKYEITATAAEGGSITPAGVSTVKHNYDITYTVTPAEGYQIADVLIDGISVGAVSEYTFDNVQKNYEITATFEEIPWENPYADVTEDDWFYEDVQYVTENELMNGTVENETFSPDLTATRNMIVTILWRLEGSPVLDHQMMYEDVSQDEYTEAIRWASANGIVQGYDGRFNPESPITREQLAAILHRYAAYKGMDSETSSPMIPQYGYSAWAENDLIWADMNGLFAEIGSDMTDMTAEASRAEVAAMLRRFCESFAAE